MMNFGNTHNRLPRPVLNLVLSVGADHSARLVDNTHSLGIRSLHVSDAYGGVLFVGWYDYVVGCCVAHTKCFR